VLAIAIGLGVGLGRALNKVKDPIEKGPSILFSRTIWRDNLNLNETYSELVLPGSWKQNELNNGTYRLNFIFNSTKMQDDSDMNITLKG